MYLMNRERLKDALKENIARREKENISNFEIRRLETFET